MYLAAVTAFFVIFGPSPVKHETVSVRLVDRGSQKGEWKLTIRRAGSFGSKSSVPFGASDIYEEVPLIDGSFISVPTRKPKKPVTSNATQFTIWSTKCAGHHVMIVPDRQMPSEITIEVQGVCVPKE